MNEEMMKRYVENQSEDEGEFRIWDLEEQAGVKGLEPDRHPVI